MEDLLQILREKQKSVFSHHGISVVNVASKEEGNSLVLQLLQTIINKHTVLYLSGGRTPKELYAAMAKEEQINPGTFALVDERYGSPMHEKSNEKMLYESGFTRYAQMRGIPFYSILSLRHPHESEDPDSRFHGNDKREQLTEEYDQQVRSLLAQYQCHIAILGVGMDGHTAGIPALSSKFKMQNSKIESDLPDWMEDLYERAKNKMVIDYEDEGGFYKERITMTFQGLSMMDLLIVLVFGKDKKPALELMFSDGSEDEIPSRFFKRPEIARKTLLITDQEVA